jgi:hypothetical protein
MLVLGFFSRRLEWERNQYTERGIEEVITMSRYE